MAEIPKQSTVSSVAGDEGVSSEMYESFSLADLKNVSKLRKELKKAQEDLETANKQVEFYKEESRKRKEDLDKEYKERRAAKKKCYKLIRMSADVNVIIMDLVSFLGVKGCGPCVGQDGCLLDNGDLEILKEIPASLRTLIEILDDAKSEDDLCGIDSAMSEIKEGFKRVKSKVSRATRTDGESRPQTLEGKEKGIDIELVDLITVPIPSSTQVEPVAVHAAPKKTPTIRVEHEPGKVVQFDAGVENFIGRRTRSSKTASSFECGSNIQEEQPMNIGEGGHTKAAVPRFRNLARATTSGTQHGICTDNRHQCLCGYTSARYLRQHIWRMTVGRHTINGLYHCNVCGDRFKSLQGLKKHFAKHQPRPGLRKSVPVPVQIETMDTANDAMPILTPQSPFSSIRVSKSPGATPQENPQSTKGLQSKVKRSVSNTAENHYEIPSQTGFSCVCGKRKSTKCQLRDHIRSETEELKFKCPSCGKRFLFQCRYRRHCLNSHKMKDSAPGPTLTLQCPLCEESFSTYTQFFDHQHAMHVQSNSK